MEHVLVLTGNGKASRVALELLKQMPVAVAPLGESTHIDEADVISRNSNAVLAFNPEAAHGQLPGVMAALKACGVSGTTSVIVGGLAGGTKFPPNLRMKVSKEACLLLCSLKLLASQGAKKIVCVLDQSEYDLQIWRGLASIVFAGDDVEVIFLAVA